MRAIFFTSSTAASIALAEDGVAAIEAGVGNFGDEELAAVVSGPELA